MKKKDDSEKIFAPLKKTALLLCFMSVLAGVCCALILYEIDVSASDINDNQQSEFVISKRAVDNITPKFASKFTPTDISTIKMKLAQSGHTVLLDKAQLDTLYGYSEIEGILANKTIDVKEAAIDPKKYNWPTIRLVSFIFNTNKCTTLVDFSEGTGGQKSQVWRWERAKNGEWQSESIPGDYVAKDVEVTKQGISFMLSPKNNPNLSNLYVLKKTAK